MSEIIHLTAAQLAKKLETREISSEEATQAHLDQIATVDDTINAFLHTNTEDAIAEARAVDNDRAAGTELPGLAGVPIAVKDMIVTTGQPTTAGSKILEGWVSPYDATVVTKLRQARMPILGKTNLDEFAMGSSTEHSAYGPTRNPWDTERIPGGSGGGSAAAVAAFEAPLALGTDTGGSIRQPGAVTGTVGVKPTYGGVSRYGAVALASSLDQIGPVSRTVLDSALLHEVIAGHDPKDSTSLDQSWTNLVAAAQQGASVISGGADLRGVRIGVITELSGEGFQAGVSACFQESLQLLRDAGAETVELSCPHFQYALGAYYLILPSEASSNLAKYDGVRFGLRVASTGDGKSGEATIEQVMAATRAAGFGAEVKRRIILGTYALSAGYYDAYYGSAQKVRTLIQQDFATAFEQVDVLISPTAPTTAFKLGEKTADPVSMYLNDIATIPANLAGVPGISVPNGLAAEDGLPSGVQLLAPAWEDARLYRIGAAVEALHEAQWGSPLMAKAPRLGA